MGKKKKSLEMWSPSSHSEKWDEDERQFKMKMAGSTKYEEHQWGYKLTKEGSKPKKKGLSKLKFW